MSVQRALSHLSVCSSRGTRLTPSQEADVRAAAVASLTDSGHAERKALLQALVDVVYRHADDEQGSAGFCLALLFQLGCNNSGTGLMIRDGTTEPSSDTAVLVCGFAGSSLTLLNNVDQFYQQQHPEWRLVRAIGVALRGEDADEAQRKQHDEIARVLADVAHLHVHVLSNFGHQLWVGLQCAHPELGARVCSCVYDCGADPGKAGAGISSPEQFAYVIVDTVWMCIGFNSVTITAHDGSELSAFTPDALKTPIERAAFALTEGGRHETMLRTDSTFDLFEWQAANEACVPTLCITSPDDRIIKEAGVQSFAAGLRRGHPERRVRVLSLKGAHCQVLNKARVEFTAALQGLWAIAGLTEGEQLGRDEYLTHDEYEAKILEEEGDALAALGF